MHLRKIVTLLLLSFSLCSAANAQERQSLNQCINYAMEHNLNHKNAALYEQSAKIDANQSKLNYLPSISASSNAGISFGRSVDPNSNDIINTEFFNNTYRLNSSIGVFNGFIQHNRVSYSKYKLEAAKWQKVNSEDDLAFNIMIAYYDVIFRQGLIAISKEQLELSGINLKKTETQIETGLKAKADLAEMQAIYEKEMLNLIQSENKLAEVELTLKQQMNYKNDELLLISITPGEPVFAKGSVHESDSLFNSFVAFSPFVKIAEAELNATEKIVAISKGRFFPSISLSASINTGYYETNKDQNNQIISFKNQFDNNRSQYLGASLSIPIFARNQIRSELRKAKISQEQASTKVDNYKQTVYFELTNNKRELQALFREYHQARKQLEADQLAYHVAKRKYDEGMINVIELLTVKNRLAGSKSQLLLSQLQWEIKDKTLDFFKGIRFWELGTIN